jgi:hypothetical protein
MKYSYTSTAILERRENLGDLDKDVRIILKLISEKYGMDV